MKQNHPSNHKDTEEDYFSEKEDVDENSDDDGNKNDENQEDGDASKKPTKIKVVIRKPQPKLDANRICGTRGLKCLLELFEKIKIKGDGHEFSDLDLIVSKYEYWAHRLFPKMKFDDVIERLEKLGDKREVKSMLNNLRLDGVDMTEHNPDHDPAVFDELTTNRAMSMMKNMNDSDDEDLQMDENLEAFLNQAEKKSTQKKASQNDYFPTEEEENEIFDRLLSVTK